MITKIQKNQRKHLFRIFSVFALACFLLNSVVPAYAQGVSLAGLPAPSTMLAPTGSFNPVLLRAIEIDYQNPLHFGFIVDNGDTKLAGDALTEEAKKLIRYFLASLTTPEKDMWVNLSPYEKDRIIPDSFGQTQMGHDLLAQDYILKQLTASLIYPEDDLGKKFWDKIYKTAYEKYGTTEIPVDTFNKIWIMPKKATVYEHENRVFVIDSEMEVMMEEDFIASQKAHSSSFVADSKTSEPRAKSQELASQIIREIVLPEIQREVNTGKNFANLRQIYNAMILAAWYKNNLKESLLGQVYVDKSKIAGIDTQGKVDNQKIYDQYLEAFKKGIYNFIKVEQDQYTNKNIPRKYFSGGFAQGPIVLTSLITNVQNPAEDEFDPEGDLAIYETQLLENGEPAEDQEPTNDSEYDAAKYRDALDTEMIVDGEDIVSSSSLRYADNPLTIPPSAIPPSKVDMLTWPKLVDKPVKIAISGIGRIGRLIVRQAQLYNDQNIEIVAIIGRSGTEALPYAQQIVERLSHDTAYGGFDAKLEAGQDEQGTFIKINGKRIAIVDRQTDAVKYPWKELGVDIVIEASGRATDSAVAKKHVEAGAKHVLIAAPAKDKIDTYVVGVNASGFDPKDPAQEVVSNASCTTNGIAPVMAVLNQFGFDAGSLNTTHAVTNSQILLDGTNLKKPEQGLAALKNIILTATGASKALKMLGMDAWGNMSGSAYRVPTLTGSIITLDVKLDEKTVTKETLVKAFKDAQEGTLKGILKIDGSLATRDILGTTQGAIVAEQSIKVIPLDDGVLAHMQIWYDNEYGYTTQLLRMLDVMAVRMEKAEKGEPYIVERPSAPKKPQTTQEIADAIIPENIKQALAPQQDLPRPIKLGLNGPGRVGRLIIRQLVGNPNFDLKVVPYASPQDLARLLANDTVHGRFNADIQYNNDERWISINGKKIYVPKTEDHPSKIDWSADDVEMVIDVTGKFVDPKDLAGHLRGTVKKVILGAPEKSKGDDPVPIDATFVYGVNQETFNPENHNVVSNASCTTNALAPVVKVFKDVFGIRAGFMSTTHAITVSQPNLDQRQKTPDREPASGANIVLTTTGAAKAVKKVIPGINMDGDALRVPVEDGSIIKLTIETEKSVKDAAAVNAVLQEAANGYLKGILRVGETDGSSKVIGTRYGSDVAIQSTSVQQLSNGRSLVTVHIFYDNEAGYTAQLIRMTHYIGQESLKAGVLPAVSSTLKTKEDDINLFLKEYAPSEMNAGEVSQALIEELDDIFGDIAADDILYAKSPDSFALRSDGLTYFFANDFDKGHWVLESVKRLPAASSTLGTIDGIAQKLFESQIADFLAEYGKTNTSAQKSAGEVSQAIMDGFDDPNWEIPVYSQSNRDLFSMKKDGIQYDFVNDLTKGHWVLASAEPVISSTLEITAKGMTGREVADYLSKNLGIYLYGDLTGKFEDGTQSAYVVSKDLPHYEEYDEYEKDKMEKPATTFFYGWPKAELPLEIYAGERENRNNRVFLRLNKEKGIYEAYQGYGEYANVGQNVSPTLVITQDMSPTQIVAAAQAFLPKAEMTTTPTEVDIRDPELGRLAFIKENGLWKIFTVSREIMAKVAIKVEGLPKYEMKLSGGPASSGVVTMTSEKIRNRVNSLIAREASIELSEITPESELGDDLGFDSVEVAGLTMDLEKLFNIEVSNKEIKGLKTVQDIYDLVDQKIAVSSGVLTGAEVKDRIVKPQSLGRPVGYRTALEKPAYDFESGEKVVSSSLGVKWNLYRLQSRNLERRLKAIEALRKYDDSRAVEAVQIFDDLASKIPKSTSKENSYKKEMKAAEFLSEARNLRKEGFDFEIKHFDERGHEATEVKYGPDNGAGPSGRYWYPDVVESPGDWIVDSSEKVEIVQGKLNESGARRLIKDKLSKQGIIDFNLISHSDVLKAIDLVKEYGDFDVHYSPEKFKYHLSERLYDSGLTQAEIDDEIEKAREKHASIGLYRPNESASSSNLGGINMSSSNLDLQIKRDDNGIPFPVSQQPIETMNIQGFTFEILNITPVPSLWLLSGLSETEGNENLTRQDQPSAVESIEPLDMDKLEKMSLLKS